MISKRLKNILYFAGALLWVFLVILGYYYFHKPITTTQFFSIGASLANLSLALLIVCLAGGIGRSLLQIPSMKPVEEASVQAALGFGLLALTFLGIGLMGGYHPIPVWGLFAAACILLREAILHWGKAYLSFFKGLSIQSTFEIILIAGVLLLLGLQLFHALSPPTAWDSLMYHFDLPRAYVEQGRFFFAADNFYWGQPQLVDMIYTLSGTLFQWQAGKTVVWSMNVLLMTGLLASLSRLSRRGALVGILAILAGETYRATISNGYVDSISAFYGYVIWILLYAWMKDEKERLIPWMGVFCGLALWVKITNGILLPIAILSVLIVDRFRKSALKDAAVMGTLSLLVFLPWLVLLRAHTGSFYPYLRANAWISPERFRFFHSGIQNPGFTPLWLPVSVTWHGLHQAVIQGKTGYVTDIGPLLLGFGALGAVTSWSRRWVRISTVWMLCGWVAMALGGYLSGMLWQTRLYYALLPASAYLAAAGWQGASQMVFEGLRLRRILGALILFVLLLTVVKDASSLHKKGSFGYVLGARSEERYLDENLGPYIRAMRHLDRLPTSSRILFLWEPRGFYAPQNAQPDVWIDRWFITTQHQKDAGKILQQWKQEGITHLLVYHRGRTLEEETRKEYGEEAWKTLDQLLEEVEVEKNIYDTYTIYSLN